MLMACVSACGTNPSVRTAGSGQPPEAHDLLAVRNDRNVSVMHVPDQTVRATGKASERDTDELGTVAFQSGGHRAWVALHVRGCDRLLQPMDISGASVRRVDSPFAGDFPSASVDGQTLAYARSSQGAGCNGEDTLVVRNLGDGKERTWAPDPAGNVYIEGLSWAPDNKTLAVLAGTSDAAGLTRTVRVLDTTQGATLADAAPKPRQLPPDADYNAVGWLGARLIANVVCCRSGIADEVGIVAVDDASQILKPTRSCENRPFGPASGGDGSPVTAVVGNTPYTIVGFNADARGESLVLIDADGNGRVWTVGTPASSAYAAGSGLISAVWIS